MSKSLLIYCKPSLYRLHSDGYNEGYFKGQILGEMEGFALGVERGKSFAQEVTFNS